MGVVSHHRNKFLLLFASHFETSRTPYFDLNAVVGGAAVGGVVGVVGVEKLVVRKDKKKGDGRKRKIFFALLLAPYYN